MAITISVLAPAAAAYAKIQAQSGNQYTADAYGVISGVPMGDIPSMYAAGCIPLGQASVRSTFTQIVDPVATNDNTQDYGVGSSWFNTATGIEWHCISAGTGAAVWVPAVSAGMLLGRIIGANMNVTTDQPFVLTNYASLNPFRITKIYGQECQHFAHDCGGRCVSCRFKGRHGHRGIQPGVQLAFRIEHRARPHAGRWHDRLCERRRADSLADDTPGRGCKLRFIFVRGHLFLMSKRLTSAVSVLVIPVLAQFACSLRRHIQLSQRSQT